MKLQSFTFASLLPLFSLACLLLACQQKASAQQALRVTTQQILDFRQLKGQPQWQQNEYNRIKGAQWIFLPDGTFLFTKPDVRSDLYPIRGTYQEDNGVITFSGSAQSQIGNTGSAMAEISGRFYQEGNQFLISMSSVASSGMAAVVYGTPFSSASSSAYEFTVSLTGF